MGPIGPDDHIAAEPGQVQRQMSGMVVAAEHRDLLSARFPAVAVGAVVDPAAPQSGQPVDGRQFVGHLRGQQQPPRLDGAAVSGGHLEPTIGGRGVAHGGVPGLDAGVVAQFALRGLAYLSGAGAAAFSLKWHKCQIVPDSLRKCHLR